MKISAIFRGPFQEYTLSYSSKKKRQDQLLGCGKKSIDDFRLMDVEPPPKLSNEEIKILLEPIKGSYIKAGSDSSFKLLL